MIRLIVIFLTAVLSILTFSIGNTTEVQFKSDGKEQDQTLTRIKQRGYLQCGVSESLPGFSFPANDGSWSGLDVDVCRAIAAAIFGDPQKIKFTPLSAKERFTALQSGEVDLLSRNTTWTFQRDTALGFDFPAISFYDGQGFMVRKSLNVKSVQELSGATLCTNTGTTTERNLADYFRTHGLTYQILVFEKMDEVVSAYNAGRCDAFTSDRSGLAAERVKLSNPDDHLLLPEIISKEPLSLTIRHFDNQWGDVVRWVFYGLLTAEELGITQQNLDQMLQSQNPSVRRLLGQEDHLGSVLNLSDAFMVQVLKATGNYGEIFDRNVGSHSPLKLERGLNNLWSQGGLMYAPPFS